MAGLPIGPGRGRAALAIAVAATVAALASGPGAGVAIARGDGADGEYERRSSSHFVLLQDVDIDETAGLYGSRRFEQKVLDVLEKAYDQLDESVGLRPDGPMTVVVHDPGVFDRRFAGFFRFAAAGFYSGTIHVRGDTAVHQSLVRVLHHELVHAALDAEAPHLAVPAWFNEGLAEWFESRAVGKRWLSSGEQTVLRRAASTGALLPLARLAGRSFQAFDPQAAGLAYLQSYGFFEHLADLRGERRLRDLTREFVRSGDLDRALRRIYRGDLAKLEAGFVASLEGGRPR